jgi:ribosome maturation factor RimP
VTSSGPDSTNSDHASAHPASPRRADVARDRVESALVEPLQELGLDLEALEITPAGKRRVLRIAVDKDGGPTLDDVAEATRAVSNVLDDSDLMGQLPYTLEVTSRGVDRPLTLPRHWRRNAGRLVRVTLMDSREITGRIARSDDVAVELMVDADSLRIPVGDISTALVQIEFNRPPRSDPAAATDSESDT